MSGAASRPGGPSRNGQAPLSQGDGRRRGTVDKLFLAEETVPARSRRLQHLCREWDRQFVGPTSETFGGEAILAVPRLQGRFQLGMHAHRRQLTASSNRLTAASSA